MTIHARPLFSVALLATAISFAGCSNEESKVEPGSTSDYAAIALEFAEEMAARQYAKAYAMTTQEYRKGTSVEQLQAAFETIVPIDWGPIGPIEVGETMAVWPGKQPADLGWAYVSIGGEVYSEAITVIVTSEQREARIREVELGRP
jgi:hypothetical protein